MDLVRVSGGLGRHALSIHYTFAHKFMPTNATHKHGLGEGEWGLGKACLVHQSDGCRPIAMAVEQRRQHTTVKDALCEKEVNRKRVFVVHQSEGCRPIAMAVEQR